MKSVQSEQCSTWKVSKINSVQKDLKQKVFKIKSAKIKNVQIKSDQNEQCSQLSVQN